MLKSLVIRVIGDGHVRVVEVDSGPEGITVEEIRDALAAQLGPILRSATLLVNGRAAAALGDEKISDGEILAYLRQGGIPSHH